jgi:hypothetical protein
MKKMVVCSSTEPAVGGRESVQHFTMTRKMIAARKEYRRAQGTVSSTDDGE